MTISVVIPTRNRRASLDRLLGALERQSRRPDEVLVIDASDQLIDESSLRHAYPTLTPFCVHMPPGVCAQRNEGIRRATGSHVLLCDDDVEPPPDYLERLATYVHANPEAGAVTGLVCESSGSGGFSSGLPVPSLRHLLFAWIFQLTVWADVELVRGAGLRAAPLAVLRRWYKVRGNTWSLAGWPLVTHRKGETLRTAVYGLGASLVHRDWLLASPYDERLGKHGIGDNYGVALGFPAQTAVTVLTDLPVLHHRELTNRLKGSDAFFHRAVALDYFLRTSPRFGRHARFWLAWSLVGQALAFALRGPRDRLGAAARALGVVVSGRNPLLTKNQQ